MKKIFFKFEIETEIPDYLFEKLKNSPPEFQSIIKKDIQDLNSCQTEYFKTSLSDILSNMSHFEIFYKP